MVKSKRPGRGRGNDPKKVIPVNQETVELITAAVQGVITYTQAMKTINKVFGLDFKNVSEFNRWILTFLRWSITENKITINYIEQDNEQSKS